MAHLWISSPLDADNGAGRLEARIAALRDM
jgi:hypothetical protein